MIEEKYGFPGENVMVAATHNHAGPAVANVGDVERDDEYAGHLTEKIVRCFGQALERREKAELAMGRGLEFNISHNRRIVMRGGTVATHGTFEDPRALCFEGPIDPEVAMLAARNPGGDQLGCMVNFAAHPTHHGGGKAFSGGYPGALARQMKENKCPVTVFLNGACGNLHPSDPVTGQMPEKEQIGAALAEDVTEILEEIEWTSEVHLAATTEIVDLPFRQPTEAEIEGTVKGAQRFVDPEAYTRMMPHVLDRIERMGTQPAEVQALRTGDWVWVGIPAEYFVQLGLRIKEQTWPTRALVVGHANGMVGYVPHAEAFERGGYETTFSDHSRLAPEAGKMLAESAIETVKEGEL
jgi:hypothetical protein